MHVEGAVSTLPCDVSFDEGVWTKARNDRLFGDFRLFTMWASERARVLSGFHHVGEIVSAGTVPARKWESCSNLSPSPRMWNGKDGMWSVAHWRTASPHSAFQTPHSHRGHSLEVKGDGRPQDLEGTYGAYTEAPQVCSSARP